MRRLSSRGIFIGKVIFPLFWFGFLGVFLVIVITQGAYHKSPVFLIQPLLMAGIGYVLMRKLIWNLADEVLDGGDFLLVRKGRITERVPLANIINVSASIMTNPPHITLRLAQPGSLGSEITFTPQSAFLRLNPFARNPIAEELIVRVDAARRGHHSPYPV